MKCLALHAFVNKLVFAFKILNQLPEALMPDVLTCQSSFDKRKSTSCCLFMLNGGSKQAETQRWKYYFGDSRPPGKSGICQLLPLLLGSIQSWNNSVELMIVYFRIRIDVIFFFLLQNAIDDCLQKIPKSNAFLLVPIKNSNNENKCQKALAHHGIKTFRGNFVVDLQDHSGRETPLSYH